MSTQRRSTPTTLLAGLGSGVAGTAVMTAAQVATQKATGGESSDTPAAIARRLLGVVRLTVPERHTATLNWASHWTYGTALGALYALAARGSPVRPLRAGLVFGSAVWATSLVGLPAFDVAPPVWDYGAAEIVQDAGFHLLYGLGTAAAFDRLGPRDKRRAREPLSGRR